MGQQRGPRQERPPQELHQSEVCGGRDSGEGAEKDPLIRAKVKHLQHRTVEEFYDLKKDPNSLKNFINSKDSV